MASYNIGFPAFTIAVTIAAFSRVRLNALNQLVLAGANEEHLGTVEDNYTYVASTPRSATVNMKNNPGTRRFVTSAAVATGAAVYGAADGKVSAVPTGVRIGIANSVSEGAGEIIEVIPCESANLLNINVADGATLTNTTTATVLDGASITLPADSLKVGDTFRVRAGVLVTQGNSSNTLTLVGLLGSATFGSTGAVDVTDGGGDVGYLDFDLVIRTLGASGTFEVTGVQALGVPGTVTGKPFLATGSIDTTVANTLGIRGTWSAASTSNICKSQHFAVSKLTPAA